MIKKILLIAASFGIVLTASGLIAYVRNPPPAVPAISPAQAARADKPYIVKIHAKWCAICMMTKDVWSQIEGSYGTRANLVVLDFTNQANTDASRAEAHRLGLDKLFDEYAGATGTIVLLDARTREVAASFHGSRDFAEYRTAIDAALRVAAR